MLIVATAGEKHVPISNVGGSTKAMIKDGALPYKMGNTNDETNSANIDELAAVRGLKREVSIWPMLVVVIASKKSTKVAIFIIVLIVGIGPIFIGIINVA